LTGGQCSCCVVSAIPPPPPPPLPPPHLKVLVCAPFHFIVRSGADVWQYLRHSTPATSLPM
jgi:hypothetical protein